MADHQTIEFIKDTIQKVLQLMSIEAQVEYEDSLVDGLVFNVRSRDAKMLIGHQGNTLHSLEHIVHAMVARHQKEDRVFFSVDVDDYKKKRKFHIKQMIKTEVDEMKRNNNTVSLPAMTNYERRFVHMYVKENFPEVNTESLGEDPSRYIKMSL